MTTKESLSRKVTRQNPRKSCTAAVHRGLTIEDLPGKGLRKTERQLRWKMFQMGQWPPVFWRVSAALEGPALLLLLEERHAAFYANVGGKKKGESL